MKFSRIAFVAVIAISAAKLSHGQQLQPNDWIPRGVVALRQTASTKTEFTLDHSTLVFASKLDPGNDDLRRVIAGVSGVSVHSYHFPGPWEYNPEDLGSVKAEYHAAGWQQLVNNHQKGGGAGLTDLWVHLQNNAVSDVAILIARATDVNFIIVSGSISPMDLFHLGGHFGIPRIEGGVEVPNNERRP